ncbi:MAG: HD domain-containing protein [Nitrososphaerota archaeon]
MVERVDRVLQCGYPETVSRRLRRIGFDITSQDVAKTVIAAALFHDVGKGVVYYQKQFDDVCGCAMPKGPSFYLHELLSAVYLDRVAKDSPSFSDGMKVLATLSVLNHMHALRDYSNIREYFRPEKTWRPKKIDAILADAYMSPESLERLVDAIDGYELFEKRAVENALGKKISYQDIHELISVIEDEEQTFKGLKLYVLVLLPLIVGDNLDAYESRRSDRETASRQHFLSELKYIWRLGG